jgi:hypothetical protein
MFVLNRLRLLLSYILQYKLLSSPYTAFSNTTCVDLKEYNVRTCYKNCWKKIILEKCGCNDIMFELQGI